MATQNSKKSKKTTAVKAKPAKAGGAKKPVKKAAVKAKPVVKAKAKPKTKQAPAKASKPKAKAKPVAKAKKPVTKAKPVAKAKPAPKKAAPVKAKAKAGKAPKSGSVTKSSKAVVKVQPPKAKAVVKGKPAPKKPVAATGSAKPKVVAKPVVKPVPVIAKAKPKMQTVKPVIVAKPKPAAVILTGSKATDSAKKPSVSPFVPASKAKQAPKPAIVHAPARPLAEHRPKPFEKMSDKKEHRPVSTLAAEEPQKSRYSDKELEEFDQLIDQKLIVAREQLEFYLKQLEDMAENPDNKIKGLDDGLSSLESERVSSLASRQQKLIQHLENAKIRIKNKVYGICRETGRLISKERLRAVPHATLSIEAKQSQN